MNKMDLSILCCSCDKYEDVWKPMFEMFDKYWDNCPYDIYLMTNQKQFNHDKVKTITTGEDKSWSIAFKHALKKINSEYVFIIMEDYLLQSKVHTSDFENAIKYMKNENLDCLRLYPCPGPDKELGEMSNGITVGLVDENAMYRISLQAAIWKKSYIMTLIDEKDSAWQFEHLGTKRSSVDGSKIASVYKNNKLIFNYYCTGVIQGYWVKEAVELCKKNGVNVNLTKIPMETLKVRYKRIISTKYMGPVKNIIKKTFIYDKYREKKYR